MISLFVFPALLPFGIGAAPAAVPLLLQGIALPGDQQGLLLALSLAAAL